MHSDYRIKKDPATNFANVVYQDVVIGRVFKENRIWRATTYVGGFRGQTFGNKFKKRQHATEAIIRSHQLAFVDTGGGPQV